MKEENIYIDEATLKEVQEAIRKAYKEGWENEDGFLLACGFKH